MIKYKVFEGMFYTNEGGLRVADYTLVIYVLGIPVKTVNFKCIDDWRKDIIFSEFKIIKNK
jgi:hypothetical protein